MTLEGYKKQFADAKNKMTLSDSACYIQKILENQYPFLPKTWKLNRHEYVKRLASRTACLTIIETLQNASPWEDYREIFAELEWPLMRRVVRHSIDGTWEGSCGRKAGEADAWFVEMWFAYQELFRKMPGTIPNIAAWRIYNNMIHDIDQRTKVFRRNL